MTLAAEGKLSLDNSANKYFTNSSIQGTNGSADAVTVRLLGAHVSGLPTMFEGYDRDEARLVLSPDALIRNYGRVAYPTRSCYEYSNIGFAALAAIASNLTGTDFGTLITQRVLKPLGLYDSFFDSSVARLSAGAARYDPSDNPIPYYTTSTPASGELYASAHDLAHFAMFNMKNHMQGQASILDDRWIDELHKPVFCWPFGCRDDLRLVYGAPEIRRSRAVQKRRATRCRDQPLYAPVGEPSVHGLDQPIQRERTVLRGVQSSTRQLQP